MPACSSAWAWRAERLPAAATAASRSREGRAAFSAEAVVVALPHRAAPAGLIEAAAQPAKTESIRGLGDSPIVNLHVRL